MTWAPCLAFANVPKPYGWDIAPPMNGREAYVGWMVANRGEDPKFLGQHWARYDALLRNMDVLDDRNKRAFLLVPREEFVLKQNLGRTYDYAFLDIGYSEYKAINSKNADGYYGWEDAGPFDKIIVTCGIDHIPPPLLQQLKTGGTMVIPVGPPGAQRLL